MNPALKNGPALDTSNAARIIESERIHFMMSIDVSHCVRSGRGQD